MAINNQTVLAVIPARGGSKRIPRKNLQHWNGKSLIEWAVRAAQQSQYIDYFCVSSEDREIFRHVESLGAVVLSRPQWLATDKATNEGVLIDTLYSWKSADWLVLLQPTSPQRTAKDIDDCIERAQLGNGCVTVNEYGKRNGAVYVVSSRWLIAHVQFPVETFDQFLIMPNNRSLDIDYPADLAH